MSDGWVIVAASGITAALAGSLIGVWAQGRREYQQWQRNQRATVYAELDQTLVWAWPDVECWACRTGRL